MKIRISTVIEIPTDISEQGYEYASAVQNIADSITHYVVIKHHEDAMRWLAKSSKSNSATSESERVLFEHHSCWAQRTEGLRWEYDIVSEDKL